MWFKNLQLHRIPAGWSMSVAQMEEALEKHAFREGGSLEMQVQGWAPPRDGGELVHSVNRQFLLAYRAEKKLLPTTVVNQVTRAKAAELEEQQGFKPGRKQMRELKEQVTDELLPRAFGIRRDTRVWIDPVNRWLVIDAASPAKADEVRSLLLKTLDITLESVELNEAPVAVMTSWLAGNDAPPGFTVDQDVELRSNTDEKAAVRYVAHPLDGADVRQHIEAGKRCTKLAMTWNDRISFVLTDAFIIKRVTPLDIIKDAADPTAEGEAEKFDADVALMTGELARMLDDLVEAVGGERQMDKAA
ncbi:MULTISPECIES: recombination-associated protein RdgC [Pandoraea]|nr:MULTISPECIES: recombination-associated protein RdgC [Pandoraea]AHB05714.2 recombinase RdgC [Pandoraea pnomenusa 3kgm]AHB78217.1 recombination-associated protein RdgC [Pandoraea pnomenusa]AHN73486.1 recombination-associated protein RdgC [Pandoraea pnomenusa]AIU25742.1 recombination-associated protein RdgC [Pandoraea pnomenusa]ANC47536.1 recombination-associated protein RdgC [Pandoraea pnomenusa]